MSPAAVVWAATGIALVVILALAVQQALRAVAEARRAVARVRAYRDLPVTKALAAAQRDVQRLQADAGEAQLLALRAADAVGSIRRGLVALRLLPPG